MKTELEKIKPGYNFSGEGLRLEDDVALKVFLSREVRNDSVAFRDYPPTVALVEAAIQDLMGIFNIK